MINKLLIFLFFSLVGMVFANYHFGGTFKYPVAGEEDNLEGVEMSTYFVGSPLGIKVGSKITILTAIINNAENPINITGVIANLREHRDYYLIYQNLTSLYVGQSVPQGEEFTIKYESIIPDNFPWGTFYAFIDMAVTYTDGGKERTAFPFNATVSIENTFTLTAAVDKAYPVVLPAVALFMFFYLLIDSVPRLSDLKKELFGASKGRKEVISYRETESTILLKTKQQ